MRVCFIAKDVYLPGVDEVLANLTEAVGLMGTVVELSDSSDYIDVFAVIQIAERQNVIVPVNCLHNKPEAG